MSDTYWTTEQTAEYLGVSPQAIYDSRARNKFPGNRGKRRGKRLLFSAEAIEQGREAVEQGIDPDAPETTNDVNSAILWALQGIKRTLDAMHNELRAQRLAHGSFETVGLAIYPEGEEE